MVLISEMDKVKYFKMLKYSFLDILEEKNKYYKNRDLLKKKKFPQRKNILEKYDCIKSILLIKEEWNTN